MLVANKDNRRSNKLFEWIFSAAIFVTTNEAKKKDINNSESHFNQCGI